MAQNEEKVVLHHEDRRWKFLSIIFIALFILSSIASVIYITNLLAKRNNLISQNVLLQQQITILKSAKQAKDISQILNKYSYVGNNPVNSTDFTGEWSLGSVLSGIGNTIWNSIVSGIRGAEQRLGSWLQRNVWNPLASAVNAIGVEISNLPEQVSDMIQAEGKKAIEQLFH